MEQESPLHMQNEETPPRPLTVSVENESMCCGAFEKDETDVEFGCVVGPLLLSVLIVVCGTASTITSKLQYEVRSYGPDHCPRHDDDGHADDNEHWHNCKFTKPWFQTLVMKIAMTVCLFITAFAQFRQNKADKLAATNVSELEVGLIDGANKLRPKPTWKSIRFIALPAATDLIQTVLAQAGLLWVSSSTYQMTRGSVIIFTCGLSVRYMGKTMTKVHWASIGIVCVAICLVGVAGAIGDESSGASVTEYVMGLALIIVGQMVGAVQFVLEEHCMDALHITPTMLVGWEGLWGTLYFLVLAPVLTLTPNVGGDASAIWHEDFVDTWHQLRNSTALVWLTVTSMLALLVYNLVGNMVTKQLSAIMRSILESCRTLGVWAVSLILWYGFDDKKSGEGWTPLSYLELAGFALLVYGTVAYKGIVKIPFLHSED